MFLHFYGIVVDMAEEEMEEPIPEAGGFEVTTYRGQDARDTQERDAPITEEKKQNQSVAPNRF